MVIATGKLREFLFFHVFLKRFVLPDRLQEPRPSRPAVPMPDPRLLHVTIVVQGNAMMIGREEIETAEIRILARMTYLPAEG